MPTPHKLALELVLQGSWWWVGGRRICAAQNAKVMPLVPSLARPPRPATSVNPTEEAASTVASAAPSTSVSSSEAPTPSPGASPPIPEAEKPSAPESVGTAEELPEDGEPDAAELRRRRLQKLESPVAH